MFALTSRCGEWHVLLVFVLKLSPFSVIVKMSTTTVMTRFTFTLLYLFCDLISLPCVGVVITDKTTSSNMHCADHG